MPASSIVCHLPLKLTCGSAHAACISSTCSSDRRPRAWKVSLWPTNPTPVPPPPEPEPDPAARQYVEAGRLFGNEHGLALRQDQHLGRKIRDLGAPGEKAEQHEWVVVKVGRPGAAWRPARPARDIDPEHMMGRRNPLVADRLRRLDEIADRVGLSADIDDRQCHAKFHLPLHSVVLIP